jgi:protein gp37
MAKTTIEWTDYTWNPWMGCHKASAGCKNCYMYREQTQYGRDPNVVVRSKTTFNAPTKWEAPALVFTCSWSDFFIEEADGWRAGAWDIIRRTPHLTYQILTKRLENVPDRLPKDWGNGWPNVWLGVSAEDQPTADARIPMLLQIPAAKHFISYEPALKPVDFMEFQPFRRSMVGYKAIRGILAGKIDQVIMGAESGPNARPMQLDWARSVRDQCQAAGVRFFLKQAVIDGKLVKMPALDGKVWDEIPER